jgi:hypothetical protein
MHVFLLETTALSHGSSKKTKQNKSRRTAEESRTSVLLKIMNNSNVNFYKITSGHWYSPLLIEALVHFFARDL